MGLIFTFQRCVCLSLPFSLSHMCVYLHVCTYMNVYVCTATYIRVCVCVSSHGGILSLLLFHFTSYCIIIIANGAPCKEDGNFQKPIRKLNTQC